LCTPRSGISIKALLQRRLQGADVRALAPPTHAMAHAEYEQSPLISGVSLKRISAASASRPQKDVDGELRLSSLSLHVSRYFHPLGIPPPSEERIRSVCCTAHDLVKFMRRFRDITSKQMQALRLPTMRCTSLQILQLRTCVFPKQAKTGEVGQRETRREVGFKISRQCAASNKIVKRLTTPTEIPIRLRAIPSSIPAFDTYIDGGSYLRFLRPQSLRYK
jgi:hypothetical protein